MKASIVISAYNGEKHISRAVRSCIDQSLPREMYEIIVVNDGSTDNTQNILDSFGDLIRVIQLEQNMGLPYACNVGIKKALSRSVIRVDADDYVHTDLLHVLSSFLDYNTTMDAVACDYLLVDEQENILERVSAKERPIACGIMFRKDRLIDIGLYDEDFLLREDEDLKIRFTKKYHIFYVPLPYYRYRKHANNSTNDAQRVEIFSTKLTEKHGFK